jgi:hypothetical protein
VRNTWAVQHAFGTVLWIVCGIGALAALVALVSSRRTWDDYGKDHLIMDAQRPAGAAPGSPGSIHEREAEIRELLEARNALRARRGEAPIDVEQELARLTAPAIDPALREEIRDLVIARNLRRSRAGKAPLEVDAEIEREIARLLDVQATPDPARSTGASL